MALEPSHCLSHSADNASLNFLQLSVFFWLGARLAVRYGGVRQAARLCADDSAEVALSALEALREISGFFSFFCCKSAFFFSIVFVLGGRRGESK